MGPFPHDAAPPAISDENPMGTDGFEFVEFCHPDPGALDRLFKVMGFSPVAKHRSKDVTLYRQGDVNFILNAEPQSFAARFAAEHGPSAPAMAFRVVDAETRLRARHRHGREAGEDRGRTDGARHPGDRGHRRPADLSRRPLRREGLDLRRRFQLDRRARPASAAAPACTTSTT